MSKDPGVGHGADQTEDDRPPSQSSPPPPFASGRMPAATAARFRAEDDYRHGLPVPRIFRGMLKAQARSQKSPGCQQPERQQLSAKSNPAPVLAQVRRSTAKRAPSAGTRFPAPAPAAPSTSHRWQVDRDRHEQKSRQTCRRASRRHEKVVPGDRVVVQSTSLTDPADSEAIPTRRRSRRRLRPRWAHRTLTPLVVLLK